MQDIVEIDQDEMLLEELLGTAAGERVHEKTKVLVTAVNRGNLEAVKALLASGAMPNAVAVAAATSIEDQGVLRSVLSALLAAGGDTSYGLWAAMDNGSAAAVKMLLDAGAEACDLDRAAWLGLTEIVGLLLEAGANPNDDDCASPIHIAVEKGLTEMVQLLAAAGADLEDEYELHPYPEKLEQLLPSAMRRPLERAPTAEVARALVEAGAKVEDPAAHYLPLHTAAAEGRASVVSVLLAAGADTEARTEQGDTALLLAAKAAEAEVLSLLLAAGADMQATDEDRATALHFAAEWWTEDASGGCPAAVEVLLAAGAPVNVAGRWGWTPLHYAAAWGSWSAVEALLAAGADVAARDENGHTPFFLAITELGGCGPWLLALLPSRCISAEQLKELAEASFRHN